MEQFMVDQALVLNGPSCLGHMPDEMHKSAWAGLLRAPISKARHAALSDLL